MDYGVYGKGAVPHISQLGQHFHIAYFNYLYTLIVQASFLILVIPLLAIWIYFSAKYKKPKKKQNEEQGQKEKNQEGQNIKQHSVHGSRVDAKSQMASVDQFKNEGGKNMQEQYTLDSAGKMNDEATKKKLQLVERKICYGVCFFILHPMAVYRFDAGILSIVTFYLTIAFFGIFNLIKCKKNAVLQGLFILPVFASAFATWVGIHQLGIHTS